MTAQTTTQRTAKHRLAVKERMARMVGALEAILKLETHDAHDGYDSGGNYIWVERISASEAFSIARGALGEPDSSNGAEKGS